MVVVSMLPHADFGPNDHRDDALHFMSHTEAELRSGKYPERVEFWLLVKRFRITSGFKLRLLLREFNPF